MRRRLIIAATTAVLLLLAALIVNAVSSAQRTVTVLASWSGNEQKAFEVLLDEFTDRTGIEVDYQGTTALREVLRSEVRAGAQPDVAILPSIGELREYAEDGDLRPLDDWLGVAEDAEGAPKAYGEPWVSSIDIGEGDGKRLYWFPVKADLKSLVWYDPRQHARDGLADIAGDSDAWCLGMGSDATSGWPGTDWVEDLLLQQTGVDAYEAWATGVDGTWDSDAMLSAWQTFGDLVAGDDPRRAQNSLRVDYLDASGELAADGCELDHQATHARGAYDGNGEEVEAAFVPSAEVFPDMDDDPNGWEVGGDFAAMFRESAEAEELIEFLAGVDAQRLWAEEGTDDLPPPLSAHQGARDSYAADAGGDAVSSAIVDTLSDAEQPTCLDASDTMPPLLRDAFQQAVLTFLASPIEFLESEERLGELLGELETVRDQVEADARWLPSACGSG